MMNIDFVLEKISFAFGRDQIDIIIEDDGIIAELSAFRVSKIDVANLDAEIVEQEKLHLLFSSINSIIIAKLNEAESIIKQLDARLSLDYERRLKNGEEALVELVGDRITDKKVEKLVLDDKLMAKAVMKRDDLNRKSVALKAIVRNLEKKHESLMTLSSKRNKLIEKGNQGF